MDIGNVFQQTWSNHGFGRRLPPDLREPPQSGELPWLRSLPTSLRQDEQSCLSRLATFVLREQLQDESTLPNLRQAVEFVSELALAHHEHPGGMSFVETIVYEPRLVELGLNMVTAQLTHARNIPRDQGFYPAVLFHREVLSVLGYAAERDDPVASLLWNLITLRQTSLAYEASRCAEQIGMTYRKTARWPSPAELTDLRGYIGVVRPMWETLARQMDEAIADNHGVLPAAVIQALTASGNFLPAECRRYAQIINRHREKRTPRDLVRRAFFWPHRVERILENLQGPLGVQRLYASYQHALWSKLCSDICLSDRNVAHIAVKWREIIARDIAYPIALGTEPIPDVREFFQGACDVPLHKKRLSRQRERCLREPLSLIESDWIADLEDLALEYAEGSEESVWRKDTLA